MLSLPLSDVAYALNFPVNLVSYDIELVKWPGQVGELTYSKKTSHSHAILSTQNLLDQICITFDGRSEYAILCLEPTTIIKVSKES